MLNCISRAEFSSSLIRDCSLSRSSSAPVPDKPLDSPTGEALAQAEDRTRPRQGTDQHADTGAGLRCQIGGDHHPDRCRQENAQQCKVLVPAKAKYQEQTRKEKTGKGVHGPGFLQRSGEDQKHEDQIDPEDRPQVIVQKVSSSGHIDTQGRQKGDAPNSGLIEAILAEQDDRTNDEHRAPSQ